MSTVCETYIEPSAIALYDYEPAAIDDLAFSVSGARLLSFVCKFLCRLNETLPLLLIWNTMKFL